MFDSGSMWQSNEAANETTWAFRKVYIVFVDCDHVRVYNHACCTNGELILLSDKDKESIPKYFDKIGEE